MLGAQTDAALWRVDSVERASISSDTHQKGNSTNRYAEARVASVFTTAGSVACGHRQVTQLIIQDRLRAMLSLGGSSWQSLCIANASDWDWLSS